MKRFFTSLLIAASTLLPCLAHAQEAYVPVAPPLVAVTDAVSIPTGVLCLFFGEGESPVEPSLAICLPAYPYDPVGNVTQITDTSSSDAAKTVAYEYDDLNRLTSATATGVAQGQTPYAHAFTYDAIGNITSGPAGTYLYEGDQGTSYANPHAATSVSSDVLTYDENGNLLSMGSDDVYVWDYNNRLASSATGVHASSYAYDESGRRVKLVEDGTTDVFPSRGYEARGGTPTKQIEANGVLVATISGTGSTDVARYVATDHLTGSSVVTAQDKSLEELLDYLPYGALRIDEKSGAFNERRKFAGLMYDVGTGLSYAGARYYDSSIGKFLSQDPLSQQNPEALLANPQLLNMYAYAANNPLRYNDPTGKGPVDTAGGYSFGLFEGLVAYGNAGMNAILHPIEAARSTAMSFADVASFVHDLASNPGKVSSEVSNGLAIMGEEFASMSDFDKGRAIGNPVGQAAGVALTGMAADAAAGMITGAGNSSPAVEQTKIHGNSLDSPRTNYGYTLRDNDTGGVLKYGETQNPSTRYSQRYLNENNAHFQQETSGTKVEVHQWQHEQIMNHTAATGARPPLNKSNW